MPLAKHIEPQAYRPDRLIDYDRGVIIRKAPDLGIEVFMYRDEPGVFYSAAGKIVAPALAKRAGYDVDNLLKKRQHREMLAVAARAIADKVGLAQQSAGTVVAEAEGHKVLDLGGGRHVIVGPEGQLLTEGVHLPREVALEVLRDMAEAAAAVTDDGAVSGNVGLAGGQPPVRAPEIAPEPKKPSPYEQRKGKISP